MVKEKKLPGGGKERKQKEPPSDNIFNPVKIDIISPLTLILLLKSTDQPTLVQVMSVLNKFVGASVENAALLVENGLLELTLPLLNHPDKCCQRYAFRLLSLITVNQTVINYLVSDESLLASFLKTLTDNEDSVLHEYTSLILCVISKDPIGCTKIVNTSSIDMFIKCLSSDDPDVQNNTMEIINSLLEDSTGVKWDDEFNFQAILGLLTSDYPQIQMNCLDCLYRATKKPDALKAKESLKSAGGVEKLLDILEKTAWKDLHSKAIEVLGNMADCPPECPDLIQPNDIRRIIDYITRAMDVTNLEYAWTTITLIANRETGKETLLNYKIIDKMMPLLKAESEVLVKCACNGLTALMDDDPATMKELADRNVETYFISAIKNNESWVTKEAALLALRKALKSSAQIHNQILSDHKYMTLFNLLQVPVEDVPTSILKIVAECVTLLSRSASFKNITDCSALIQDLVRILQDTEEDTLRITVLNCFNQLVLDAELARHIMKGEGIEKIWSVITENSKSVPLAAAAARFVQNASANYRPMAIAFIKASALHWMLRKKQQRKMLPVWESAMEALLSSHLPAKFAYKGRLDMNDIITEKETFYMVKPPLAMDKLLQNDEKFPDLDELQKMNPKRRNKLGVIFIVNTKMDKPLNKLSFTSSSSMKKTNGDKNLRAAFVDDKENLSYGSKELVKMKTVSATSSTSLCADHDFDRYVEDLKMLLRETPKFSADSKHTAKDCAVKANDMETYVRLLANFVCDQLSGPTVQKTPCTSHYVDLHIEELKVELDSNLIPIGRLRAGTSTERALLFKALADRVGIPCSLVRGATSPAIWIEVALTNKSQPTDTFPPCLPSTLMRPSHMVDLLHTPGRLMPIRSHPTTSEYYNNPQQNILPKEIDSNLLKSK